MKNLKITITVEYDDGAMENMWTSETEGIVADVKSAFENAGMELGKLERAVDKWANTAPKDNE